MERSQLPAFLRERMRAEGIASLRQLAARAGISPETARQLLEGTREPRDRTLAKVAIALRVPVERLREAAGRSSGEQVPFRLPPEADQLTGPQREVVLGLVRALLASGAGEARGAGWAARQRRS